MDNLPIIQHVASKKRSFLKKGGVTSIRAEQKKQVKVLP
jgi:hypothetical protein